LNYLIVILIWIGFGFIHSLLIDLRFSNWVSRVMGRYYAYYRLSYNILSLILFIVLLTYSRSLDSELVIKFIPPWTIFQNILLVGSGFIIIWAFLSYDALDFMGIHQIREFGEKDNTSQKTITSKGLLGVVRHPMYLATIVFMWSLNSTRVDILVHLVLTIYIIIGIKLEERKLIKQFGLAYIDYQKNVPALIPFTKKGSYKKLEGAKE
jgi:methanethiol S-methyltransferase